jgi:hypothetical protein
MAQPLANVSDFFPVVTAHVLIIFDCLKKCARERRRGKALRRLSQS